MLARHVTALASSEASESLGLRLPFAFERVRVNPTLGDDNRSGQQVAACRRALAWRTPKGRDRRLAKSSSALHD
jgi:hypothetical protein